MRILGADSFFGRTTSINAIPVNVVRHGDLCAVHISDDSTSYTPGVYFYEFVTNDGNDDDIPFVIVPLDNIDVNLNTGQQGDDGSRWKLKNVYVKSVHAQEIVTSSIITGDYDIPVTINESLQVYPTYISVDGQVIITTDWDQPPLVVNSPVMVENLNAHYFHDRRVTDFVRNRNFELLIPNGVTEMDVYFTHAIVNPPHYSVMIEICNIVDDDPSIYAYTITNKTETHFTIKFSGIIDSPNYTLHYFVIGDTDPSVDPPPPIPPSGDFPPPSGFGF
jgi:hypothetical protein